MKFKPKVLLVEDEKIVQKVHIKFLENFGCEVDLAESSEQAVAKFNNGSYDIIFMDVGLPDVSGIDATAKIRSNENEKKRIPIIVLTGYIQEEIKNQCLAAGADDVFTKPINLEKLHEILRNYFNRDLTVSV